MENLPPPEKRGLSPLTRLNNFVAEKKAAVIQAYGQTDWRTSDEITNSLKIFVGGVTVAAALAIISGQPGVSENLVGTMGKVFAGSIGIASIGAGEWAGFKNWAIAERQKLTS